MNCQPNCDPEFQLDCDTKCDLNVYSMSPNLTHIISILSILSPQCDPIFTSISAYCSPHNSL